MPVEIHLATTRKYLREFLRFPYRLYHGHPCWIPPLIREQKDWIYHRNTPLFKNNPGAFFLAQRGTETVGRIAVAEDRELVQKKNSRTAYFTFLEAIDDREVFMALMGAAQAWAKLRKLRTLQGPVSPSRGDDFRGLLIRGFEGRPVFMDAYHYPYYQTQLEALGYEKRLDLYAYRYDLLNLDFGRRLRAAQYAQRRHGFRIERFDKRHWKEEARDIKYIIDRALPDEWPDLTPPSYEEILIMARRLRRFADPDLVLIARDKNDQPIGFNVALPDYNTVLEHLKGHLGPIGLLKFLYYRRRIQGGRSFIMFVIPSYRQKGVAQSIYLTAFRNAQSKGYTYGEGSTIGEENLPMRRDAEKLGGRHYRTYRIYHKKVA